MNSLACACVALIGTAATACADPKDRAIIAAMTLSDRPNYSWFTMVDDDASSYEIEGKTDGAGLTWVRMPMVKSVGRRLGREDDSRVEALFWGKNQSVVRTGETWTTLAELSPAPERTDSIRTKPMTRGSANAGTFGGFRAQPPGVASRLEDRRDWRASGTLTFGVTHPHEELAIIVSSFTTMEVIEEVATGSLSELGAALLLVGAEHKDTTPLSAAGSFKLWLKQGAVVKYQLKLAGVLAVAGRRNMDVQLTTITSLKEIGSTRVTVPDKAREKFGP